jgi:hypothetical protein
VNLHKIVDRNGAYQKYPDIATPRRQVNYEQNMFMNTNLGINQDYVKYEILF